MAVEVLAIPALRRRIAAAKSADGTLSTDIMLALGARHRDIERSDYTDRYWRWPAGSLPDGSREPRPIADGNVTFSMSAIMAAVARLRPGWGLSCDGTVPSMGIDWTLHHPDRVTGEYTGTGATHELALCDALLRSFEEQV